MKIKGIILSGLLASGLFVNAQEEDFVISAVLVESFSRMYFERMKNIDNALSANEITKKQYEIERERAIMVVCNVYLDNIKLFNDSRFENFFIENGKKDFLQKSKALLEKCKKTIRF